MYGRVLRGYECYIRSRQLVKEAQVPHYVRWVRTFLLFASNEGIRYWGICVGRRGPCRFADCVCDLGPEPVRVGGSNSLPRLGSARPRKG